MSPFASNSLLMMEQSMNFLWAKQAAHLDNIANAETPGYKVKTVTFEERLDARLRASFDRYGSARRLRKIIEDADWTVSEDEETTRMDDNGVNIIEQSLEASRTAYQIQYVMQSISSDLSTLSKAING